MSIDATSTVRGENQRALPRCPTAVAEDHRRGPAKLKSIAVDLRSVNPLVAAPAHKLMTTMVNALSSAKKRDGMKTLCRGGRGDGPIVAVTIGERR